jgi:hypothetical protein
VCVLTFLPTPEILFSRLRVLAGTDGGARERFQSLVTELVAIRHPTANEVAGPGGTDWGIDTYVGRLDDSIVVWQSKFFVTWNNKDPQSQVRASFREIIKKAQGEGFKIDAWTLCVPCTLHPDQQKWWDGWSTRESRKYGITISLWNGVKLRRLLSQPDAADLYRAYFLNEQRNEIQSLAEIDDLSIFSDALFVRQLEEAGYIETDFARGLFFAADALVRDMASAGNREGVAALQELHLEVQGLWESRFNRTVQAADGRGRMQGLVEDVLLDAAQCPDPEGLRLRPAHRKGVVHRLVEDARAGWVRQWREIVTDHRKQSAGQHTAGHVIERAMGDQT